MPLAAYAHGWRVSFQPSEIVNLARMISWFDFPMMGFVFLTESAFLFILWRRSLAVVLLSAIMMFHLGVFFLYGYLFWTWILLNAALVILLARDRHKISIFGRPQLAISVVLIAFSSWWAHPSHLGWYDTRMTYTYRYEATGESGARYTIAPRFFEPYGDVFTMSNFGYLPTDHGMLVYPYGITTNRERAERTLQARTREEIFFLESEIGAKGSIRSARHSSMPLLPDLFRTGTPATTRR